MYSTHIVIAGGSKGHFVHVALIVHGYAKLPVQKLHLENGSPISNKDMAPDAFAQDISDIISLPANGIPCEFQIYLRGVTG